jgi:hypothetical protein
MNLLQPKWGIPERLNYVITLTKKKNGLPVLQVEHKILDYLPDHMMYVIVVVWCLCAGTVLTLNYVITNFSSYFVWLEH